MATYVIEYSERLETSFEVEAPDGMDDDQFEDWLQAHWDDVMEPRIQTHDLEVTESGHIATLVADEWASSDPTAVMCVIEDPADAHAR
ncbi:hypothetical protein BLEM_2080 [Bifidobacterium lemurum]|uniref:Uncharacterized protein n=1 Tax=Bifidobacterium lemurum TaxID=1603886 RepID=A0A261FLN4_9BIFI|nr:hypothetical protein [Bifidobacterium lemurum]OZG59905.1 hypothetical protein BLEM_2080 [Bifidobacterium lemurum]QOL33931.1 hypothetical protein BL8807_09225 [Bifidobacterium lemurum]